jgi:hypothetical protein
MRRLGVVLLLAFGLVAAGCSGAEGQRAQQLLEQAQAAERNVRSATFDVEVNATFDGQKVGMSLRGGGYTKGARAGDMFIEAKASGALGGFDFGVISQGDQAYLNMNGTWRRMPRPASMTVQTSGDLGSAAFLQLARYVKKVNVLEHQLFNGEPTSTISGTVDTAGLVAAMAKLNGVTELAGDSAPDLSQLADHLGDTRATILISERTHLVAGAVVSLSLEAQGKKVDLQLIYRLSDVNKPVQFPPHA